MVDEDRDSRLGYPIANIEKELRRRTWYTCYNFDRLLSLQSGRPRGIRLSDCAVRMPVLDFFFDCENDAILPLPEGPHSGHFYTSAVQFSHIVEEVINDLYPPNATERPFALIGRTVELLDQKLLDWKDQLSPHLRFDLDPIHAHDSDAIFKKQRNILALKFHHLRALIHRKSLCVEWLTETPTELANSTEEVVQQIQASGTICGLEAVAIARMLGGIAHDTQLVGEYPW